MKKNKSDHWGSAMKGYWNLGQSFIALFLGGQEGGRFALALTP